jgi:hypothetical protein
MPIWLKQSTARAIAFGPFLDETDGKTAEVSLSISQTDIRIKKTEGNWAQKNAAQLLLHEENGWYEISLDATDTATLGEMVVAVHKPGALPVWDKFMVVPTNVYESVISGTTVLNTNASQWAGVSTSASDIALLPDTTILNVNAVQWNGVSTSASDVAVVNQGAVIAASVSGAVGSVSGLTASDVGDIKTKTDQLTFTKANELDSNMQSVNGVTINGDGAGTPMGV